MWYVGVATLYIFLASRSDGLPACSAAAARRWNAALALFSALGVAQLAPLLLGQLRRRSAVDVLCDATYWIDDPWALAFVLSKVVELGDTVLLLARGKPLSFLHVYHHSSVLVFSAHAYHVRNPAGLWYMVLNLLVHSLMYTYYCAPPGAALAGALPDAAAAAADGGRGGGGGGGQPGLRQRHRQQPAGRGHLPELPGALRPVLLPPLHVKVVRWFPARPFYGG